MTCICWHGYSEVVPKDPQGANIQRMKHFSVHNFRCIDVYIARPKSTFLVRNFIREAWIITPLFPFEWRRSQLRTPWFIYFVNNGVSMFFSQEFILINHTTSAIANVDRILNTLKSNIKLVQQQLCPYIFPLAQTNF